MRRAPLLLAILLLAAATGAIAAPPKSASFSVDGVRYLYITGVNRTGTAELNGERMALESCAFVMMNPNTPNGRVFVMTLQNGIAAAMFIDQFRLANGTRGYAFDQGVTVDGLPRTADLAIQGNASIRVLGSRYYDPVSSTGIDSIDKNLTDMSGSLALVPVGTRDDVTGQVVTGAGARDEELHVHVHSAADAVPADRVISFSSPNPITPTEAYGSTVLVENSKLGGVGTVQIASTAYAMAGSNEFNVRVIAPDFREVVNFTVAPALLADDSGSATFPLDQLGYYFVMITGKASLGSYTGSVTLAAPKTLDLHFWYENVTYGRQAYDDFLACSNLLQSPDEVVGVEHVVGRPKPPQFSVAIVAAAVAAGIAVVTVGVKLVSDQISLSAFRKAK